MKKQKFKPLDIVRTQFGTFAVVESVNEHGALSLVLPQGSTQKVAWYEPSELKFVGSVKEMVECLAKA